MQENTNLKYVWWGVGLLVVVGLSVLVWQMSKKPENSGPKPLTDAEKAELLKNIPNTPPLTDAEKQALLKNTATNTKPLTDEERNIFLKD